MTLENLEKANELVKDIKTASSFIRLLTYFDSDYKNILAVVKEISDIDFEYFTDYQKESTTLYNNKHYSIFNNIKGVDSDLINKLIDAVDEYIKEKTREFESI